MFFELQPVLNGELIRLRPLRPEDWEDLYAVASDPLIWEQHPVQDRYKEEVFKGFLPRGPGIGRSVDCGLMPKVARSSGRRDSTDTTKKRARSKSAGPFLARSHWGGIYNKEMKRLMLRHAFKVVRASSFSSVHRTRARRGLWKR